MSIALQCRCGQVRGEVDTDRTYVRAICYCRYCQAFARWLGTPGLTDDKGGSDIVAMSPSRVRFTAGEAQVACITLSRKGPYRWYAACCRTPIGNTPRTPDMHYVGLCTPCLEGAGDAVDEAFGPAGECVINTGSATAPVAATPLAFVLGGLRILKGVLGARLRGLRQSPFFDDAGQPLRKPQVVAMEREPG